MSIYSYEAHNIRGQEIGLDTYQDKVILVVNTASKCGFTRQYEGLQKLYETYKDQGLVILGFPCNQFGEQEPGDKESIESFCLINYGVSFPMFDKIEVNGSERHPLFAYLTSRLPAEDGGEDVKWNFTKFLIDREGRPVNRFEPKVEPEDLASAIEALL